MSSKVYMWEQYTEEQHAELESLCNRYKECLDAAKTERECVTLGIWMAKEHGYRDLSECMLRITGRRFSRIFRWIWMR